MDVVTLIFLWVTLIFRCVKSTEGFHGTCPELWRLTRSTNDAVLVSFTNKTLPGNYSYFLWHWETNTANQWNTYLWTSHQTDKLLGNAVLRKSDRVVMASIVWKLHNGTLEWSYYGSELNESYWAISLCGIADWSFTPKTYGKWAFRLGEMNLYQPYGKEIKFMVEKPSEKEVNLGNSPKPEMPGSAENQISEATTEMEYLRLRRSKPDKEDFHLGYSNSSPAEKWSVVEAVLDRVFGNSDDIRQNGWVSHLNIFNILGRLFGLDLFRSVVSSVVPTTTQSSPTEPDAETLNTNFMRRFPGGGRIISKKKEEK